MTIKLPEKVRYILKTIEAAGFEAYAVGGCIRDSLLNRIPEDWDITTSAEPQQVKSLFKRTVDTGIQHGTITIMLDKEGFEVTTYRIDGEYEDGRHPKQVQYTADIVEDLKRRDFTINAMAYSEKQGLIDVFHGLEDLREGIIRCVGNPRERFTEDALRMMRAVRFSAQLGFAIDTATRETIKELAPTLSCISAERIQMELVKLLLSPHPDFLRVAYDTGITKVILPEFNRVMETPQNHPHHCYSVGEHILHSLLEVPSDKVLRLSMLFHDIAKPDTLSIDQEGITHFYEHQSKSADMSRIILRRLRMDNSTIDQVYKLVYYHDYGNDVEPSKRIVRRAIYKIGEDLFPSLLLVRRADILAQSTYLKEEKLSNLEAWNKCYEKIVETEECVSLKTLAVNGSDLIAEGITKGKQIGVILNLLLEEVLEEPEKNNKEYLLKKALETASER